MENIDEAADIRANAAQSTEGHEEKYAEESRTEVGTETISLKVIGMDCKECAKEVEERLAKISGVKKANVGLEEEPTTITFNPSETDEKEIKAIVEELGYLPQKYSKGAKKSREGPAEDAPKGGAQRYLPHIACAGLAILLFLFVAMPMLAGGGNGAQAQDSTPSTGLFSQAASAPQASAPSTANTGTANLQTFRMSVKIPCGGHTPLILSAVKKIGGVVDIKTSGGWNIFEVTYDGDKTSKETILGGDVFKSYPATVL